MLKTEDFQRPRREPFPPLELQQLNGLLLPCLALTMQVPGAVISGPTQPYLCLRHLYLRVAKEAAGVFRPKELSFPSYLEA